MAPAAPPPAPSHAPRTVLHTHWLQQLTCVGSSSAPGGGCTAAAIAAWSTKPELVLLKDSKEEAGLSPDASASSGALREALLPAICICICSASLLPRNPVKLTRGLVPMLLPRDAVLGEERTADSSLPPTRLMLALRKASDLRRAAGGAGSGAQCRRSKP
jgi:hypothetical protein